MQVRSVEPDELENLKELRLRALLDAPQAFGSTFEREVDRSPDDYASWVADGCVTFVAADEAGWQGLAVGQPDRDVEGIAHVLSMWVAPEHRRAGLGGELLDRLVAWGWQRGAERMRLGVAEGNSPARSMYLAYGFRPTGECEPLRSDPSRTCEFLELARPHRTDA